MKPKYSVSKNSPKWRKPRKAKNSCDMVVPMNGRSTLYQAKYQLAPAVTKKAPDKNLKISCQLILFTLS